MPRIEPGETTPHYTNHRIVALFEDGRLLAEATNFTIDNQGGAWVALNVRLPDLKYIEKIVHVELTLGPIRVLVFGPYNKKIVGNVVGMSIYNTTPGTTITAQVVGVGPP